MATVFIPTMLLPFTQGTGRLELEAATVAAVIAGLEERFPGIREHLVEEERLMPGLAVAVDGELSTFGLRERVGPRSEVHFLPALAGG
ncbi:MAG: MoaD/ThiS family protein [Dehalococcoidia bacterium]